MGCRISSITADIIESMRCLKVMLVGFASRLKCFEINPTFVMVRCVGGNDCTRCNMEFISDGHIMILSQHIIDKHHGKMYLPYEMIKDQFIVED
jgi:hypothetical protein